MTSNDRYVLTPAAVRLYNTRSGRVERFTPMAPPAVGIYSCGPTVYAPQHLGNMRSQLVPDLLRRVLTAARYQVTYVTNITDVGHLVADRDDTEDKMEVAAARLGRSAADIAARYTEQWAADRRRLGCLEPDVLPRASAHIAQQIEVIRLLEQRGHTYDAGDGLYFDVSTFPRYADFARLDLDRLATTGRVHGVGAKRHPADFALWKRTPAGVERQQEWDSPWGRGFPGWHVECTAMAAEHLGRNFDIHTGGIDHIPVHHSNEIAQSECAFEISPWVGTWMHVEFLDLSGRKISKSEGDALVVDTVVGRGLDPLAVRYFFLQAQYRRQQTFSWESVEAAATALRRLRALTAEAVAAARETAASPDGRDPDGRNADNRNPVSGDLDRFWRALADDLNAPRALAVLWEVVRNRDLDPADRLRFLSDADRGLGLELTRGDEPTDSTGSDRRIDDQVAARDQARQAKDFVTSDRIRSRLAAEGIELIDTEDGTRWRRARL